MRKLEFYFLTAAFMAVFFLGTRRQVPVFPTGLRDALTDDNSAYQQAGGTYQERLAPEPAAPVRARPEAGSGGTDNVFLDRARAHYLRLKNSGHLNVEARIAPGTDPQYGHTPAYVVYDFAGRRCNVYINAGAVRTSEFEDEFSFRYMMYHELSHCDLYANPREIRAFPALGGLENRMISDLVHLEFLHSSEAGRVNGYNTYHETYADIKAMALLIAEGQPAEKIQSVVDYREGNTGAAMDSHDNAGVFSKVRAVRWEALDAKRMEEEIRSLADPYIAVNFLDKVFHPGMVPFTASDLLAGSLRTPLSTLRFRYSDPEDLAFIKRRLAEIDDAPQTEWREYSQLALSDLDDKGLISAFFKARYGRAPEELRAEDEALNRAVTSALRRP